MAGMVRTKIGFASKEDFFETQANCQAILQGGLESQIPLLEDGRFLAPVPADLIFSQRQDKRIKVNIPTLSTDTSNVGTDIANSEWLIPSLDLKNKPAREKPFFLYKQIDRKLQKRYKPTQLTAIPCNTIAGGKNEKIALNQRSRPVSGCQ